MGPNKLILTKGDVEQIRAQAARAIAPLKPLQEWRKYKWGGARTDAGRELPPYYLVYFLLADLLNFPQSGMDEKVAWSIPVDFNSFAATIEHRKLGLGVFFSKTPEDEAAAAEIVAAVRRGVGAARRYFDHLAAHALTGSRLNVSNNSPWLFGRYTYLRDLFKEKAASVQNRSLYDVEEIDLVLDSGSKVKHFTFSYSDSEEAKWVGVAAIEALDVRRMLESIATCTERHSGRKLLNAIEDNANEQKLRDLMANVVKTQGLEAAMNILKNCAAHHAQVTPPRR
jgi:hypothetical protein